MTSPHDTSPRLTRRAALAGAGLLLAPGGPAFAAAPPEVRLGILQFGTVQWVADVIRRHGLDTAHGFALRDVTLANTDAGRVSLMAEASDVVVSDWPFVASQRAAGTKLAFAPFSSSSGGIMTGPASTLRTLADLRGRKLGVAGGPLDKSWLVVRAAAKASAGLDLATEVQLAYGAPPLLGAKLAQGELDAVLTFWNFAARLEAAGCREIVSVAQCAASLGLPEHLNLIGFVFHEDWAEASRPAIDGFLAAVGDAEKLLIGPGSDAEWQAVRPLMDAADDALFARLKDRFRAGIAPTDAAAQEAAAARLLAILRQTGGARATDGLDRLPPGIFWRRPDEAI
jgi:NitT/TauT family transport system substrate-binding protein